MTPDAVCAIFSTTKAVTGTACHDRITDTTITAQIEGT